jgi:hypothetical protein
MIHKYLSILIAAKANKVDLLMALELHQHPLPDATKHKVSRGIPFFSSTLQTDPKIAMTNPEI